MSDPLTSGPSAQSFLGGFGRSLGKKISHSVTDVIETNRRHREDARIQQLAFQQEQQRREEHCGSVLSRGQFGDHLIEMFSEGYVRVSTSTVARPSWKAARYERLIEISFTNGEHQVPPSSTSDTMKAVSVVAGALSKGLKASAPGLALVGAGQVMKLKMGKSTLIIVTDMEIHELTNERQGEYIRTVQHQHVEIGQRLFETGLKLLSHELDQPVDLVGSSDTGTHALPSPSSVSERLRELKALHSEGILDDEEFASAKAKLLDSL